MNKDDFEKYLFEKIDLIEQNPRDRLEYLIFSCLVNNDKRFVDIDLEEKYFKHKDILKALIETFREYGSLEEKILAIKYNHNKKIIDFIFMLEYIDPATSKIVSYYKLLKEMYRDEKITELTNKLKSQEISQKEFNKQYKSLETDFENVELLKLSSVGEDEPEREYTKINELDYLLKGIEYGKLSLWSGITNHGKTTLMIQLAKECLKKHKKIFYFSGEQTSSEFKNYLYIGLCTKEQLNFVKDNNNERIYDVKPKKEITEYFDDIYKDLIYLYNNETSENDINSMIKSMNLALKQGVRIFFIDNFMQLDNSERLEEQTRIVEQFKRFARDNNVIINLVAHPRKTQFQKNRLTIFDIAGTQNIVNKSSNICTIMRTDILPESEKKEISTILIKNNYAIEQCDAIIEVLKTKGNYCKMIGLVYDFDTKTYKESQKVSDEYKPFQKKKREYEEDIN